MNYRDDIRFDHGVLLTKKPDRAGGNINDVRENIAHKERSRKIRDVSGMQLTGLWNDQLSEDEKALLYKLPLSKPNIKIGEASVAVKWSETHLFDRKSVVQEHEVWRHALEHARGQYITIAEIKAATEKADYLREENGLSGDTRQHGAVEASDALRAIERYFGIKPTQLNLIRRQDPHQRKQSLRNLNRAAKARCQLDMRILCAICCARV